MKYFLHDTNAFQDEKITELFMAHGYEGLGLFYSILEKLAQQEKPIKTVVLKQQLSVGKKLEKCWLFLESLQLISSNNGETFNDNLLKFSEKYQVSKEKNREKVSQWREKQALKESVTGYVPVRNAPKVKISKVNTTDVVPHATTTTEQPLKAKTPKDLAALLTGDNDQFTADTVPMLNDPRLFGIVLARYGYGHVDADTYQQQIRATCQAKEMNAGVAQFESFIKAYLNGDKQKGRLLLPPGHGLTPNEIPGNWDTARQGAYTAPMGQGIPHPSSFLKPEFIPTC